ncbi:excisionase [Arsenophonus sp. PmNCSU2021_1]|uniref:excisionase n=1 Tax=Arsenophonus sp. PmNCSU2021_1 TaxID=3118989 RepID=UPI002FF3B3C9
MITFKPFLEFYRPVRNSCTLQRYARNGHFYPPARKEGGIWRVREDAELVGDLTKPFIDKNDNPTLQRILNDGC